jgi:hypothetical protein
MTDMNRRTGNVTSRRGRIKAQRINTGLTIEGAADSETVRAATEALGRLQTGDVTAARGIDSAGEINVGISYDLTADSEAAEIRRHLLALQQLLHTAAEEGGPAEVSLAASLTDQLIASTESGQKGQGHPKAERVREIVNVLARAGMTVETASACATAVAEALKLALEVFGMIH